MDEKLYISKSLIFEKKDSSQKKLYFKNKI